MFRSLTLLMMLLIIGFSLSILPLDVKSFEIDFDRVFAPIEAPSDPGTPSVDLAFTLEPVSSEAVTHFNPQQLLYALKAPVDAPEDWFSLVTARLVIQDQLRASEPVILEGNDLGSYLTMKASDQEGLQDLQLDLSDLTLKDGYFSVRLELSHPSQATLSSEHHIHKLTALTYQNQTNANAGHTIKLYYADASKTLLIPVYRSVPSTDKLIRTSLNGLMEVPQGMGLNGTALAPRVSRADFTGGVVKCSILTRDLPEGLTEADTRLFLQSIANTLFDIEGSYVINQVVFALDQNPQAVLNNVDLSIPFNATGDGTAYLPYTGGPNILLTPFTIEASDPQQAVTLILQTLQSIKPEASESSLSCLMPPSVKLLNQRIEGRTLVLNFDGSFKDLYFNRPDLQHMLIDALTLSFTSINDIDQLALEVEGQSFGGWKDVALKYPLLPPVSFNLAP